MFGSHDNTPPKLHTVPSIFIRGGGEPFNIRGKGLVVIAGLWSCQRTDLVVCILNLQKQCILGFPVASSPATRQDFEVYKIKGCWSMGNTTMEQPSSLEEYWCLCAGRANETGSVTSPLRAPWLLQSTFLVYQR